jgi:hypothetical protein
MRPGGFSVLKLPWYRIARASRVISITFKCDLLAETQNVEVGGYMNTGVLIGKLLDIERAIGIEDSSSLRTRIIDAQDCALQVQKRAIEELRVRSGFSIVRECESYRRSA